MNETQLARIEAPLGPLAARRHSTSMSNHRWQYQVEASCWLFLSIHAPDIDLIFCLEYTDALKKHSVVIDRTKVGYLRDSLMAGNIAVEGFGEIKSARLMIISDEAHAQYEVKALNFNVTRSSELAKPRYRLVA